MTSLAWSLMQQKVTREYFRNTDITYKRKLKMNSMEIMDYLLDNLELPDDANTQYIADEIYYQLDYTPIYNQIDTLAKVMKNN
tara:strand:+ start:1542 stop:1790 length:249 start_codon:yes stop_codon:yes gene_type:complete